MRKLFYFLIIIGLTACIDKKSTEDEQPKINLLSPLPCDTLYFGESFHFTIKVTDNTGMGDISMDMHNNFGHHNHGAHETCAMDDPKEAVDPFAESWIFSLPEQHLEYVFDTVLALPAYKIDSTAYDFGDYHFHLYVTDNDGYQVFTSLDVKALHR